MKRTTITFALFLAVFAAGMAKTDDLQSNIKKIIGEKKATVGVAIYNFDTKETVTVNGELPFPMQSVYKLHLAMNVLDQTDKGTLKMGQEVFISKDDYSEGTWSPIQEKYPKGNIKLPLSEIMRYTVAQSDNTGCDVLFKLTGGTESSHKYIQSLGIKDVSIKYSERQMHSNWNYQFKNWTTPLAATELLKKFNNREILSQASYDFLWKTLAETTTGAKRLKGKLPAGTVVAHKTGTSGADDKGLSAATNDIGIIVMPNGKRFAISVFITNSRESETVNDEIIADIAKAAWDYYVK